MPRKSWKGHATPQDGGAAGSPPSPGAGGPPDGRSGSVSAIGIAYIKFAALLLGLFTLSQTSLCKRLVIAPVANGIATLAAVLLGLTGIEARAEGSVIRSGPFAAMVDTNCTGLFVMFIYLSAVVAYPSAMREKLLGVALGFGALFTLNLVRVSSLVLVGAARPDMLNVAHYLVWQSVMIVAALCLWLFWSERVADAPGH